MSSRGKPPSVGVTSVAVALSRLLLSLLLSRLQSSTWSSLLLLLLVSLFVGFVFVAVASFYGCCCLPLLLLMPLLLPLLLPLKARNISPVGVFQVVCIALLFLISLEKTSVARPIPYHHTLPRRSAGYSGSCPAHSAPPSLTPPPPPPAYITTATLHIHRQSAYLVGREKRVADIVVDHPSCSKQHAVVQFRLFERIDEKEGTTRRSVR